MRCFSSPRSLPDPMYSDQDDSPVDCRVSPFGYLWIKACSRLPKAFRNVLRPSSPLDTKASTVCPYLLFLTILTSTYMHTHSTQLSKNTKRPKPAISGAPGLPDLSIPHNHRCGHTLHNSKAIDLPKLPESSQIGKIP